MKSQEEENKQITILLVGGYWSTNVGNAFYELGIMYVFNCVDGAKLIRTTDSQTISWSMWNSPWASPFNPYEKCDIEEVDYVVIAGPMMALKYLRTLEPFLKRCKERDKRIVFISAGGNKYDQNERSQVRSVLKGIIPYALITRDHETYLSYFDLFMHSYDGICFASFIPEFFEPWRVEMAPYIVLDMESNSEPEFIETNVSDDRSFLFNNKYWKLKKPIRSIKRVWPRQKTIGSKIFEDYDIVRPKNTCFRPSVGWYKGNNIFLSDIPEDYLNIYANACACISDRVHTCVASLVLGRPTLFLGNTARQALFESLIGDDAKRLSKEFVRIDPHQLEQKRNEMKQIVKEVISV